METNNNSTSQKTTNPETFSIVEATPKDVDYFDATSMKSAKKPANNNAGKKSGTPGHSGNMQNKSANAAKNTGNISKNSASASKNQGNMSKINISKNQGNTPKNNADSGKNSNFGASNKQQQNTDNKDTVNLQDKPDTLVVFYTRTGNSRIITDYIVSNTGAHMTELKDKPEMDRAEVSVSGAMKAAFGLRTQLMPVEYRPVNYQKIVLVTPIWCFCMTPQIRTYISYFSNDLQDKDVYMVTVSGISKGKSAAKSSENDYGIKPKAQFSLCLSDIKNGEYVGKLSGLIEQLK